MIAFSTSKIAFGVKKYRAVFAEAYHVLAVGTFVAVFVSFTWHFSFLSKNVWICFFNLRFHIRSFSDPDETFETMDLMKAKFRKMLPEMPLMSV